MTLKQFQDAFSAQLLSPNNAHDTPYITQSNENVLRMKIYQNNVYSSLLDILKNRYPISRKLVGDDFFTVLGQQYIANHPPESPVMLHYGESLPRFIEQHKDKHNIAYLSDIAVLESARHKAYYAKDNDHLQPADIARKPIEKLLESSINMVPSAVLIQSSFSIHTIWLHLKESDQTLNTDISHNENIFIFKKNLGVQTLRLQDAYAYFIQLLLNKNTLGESLEKLIEFKSEENFEPTEAISFLIQNQLIKTIH